MIEIETEPPVESQCDCCGGTTIRLTRFVYRDGDAYAVYYAQFSPNHAEKRLNGLIGLGNWGEDGKPENRVAFPFQIWLEENQFSVGLTDANESPWSHVTFLGKILDRESALRHELAKEVFHITDHMVSGDPEITSFFNNAGPTVQ